jgi:hypothetical protein
MSSNPYLPSLASLLVVDDLPEAFGFLKGFATDFFDDVFYHTLRVDLPALGGGADYDVTILTEKAVRFDLFGSGLFFVVNPSPDPASPGSEFRLRIQYRWELLRFLSSIDFGALPTGLDGLADFVQDVLAVAPSDLLRRIHQRNLASRAPIPLRLDVLVQVLNEQYGLAGSANEIPFSDPTTYTDIVNALNTAGISINTVIEDFGIATDYPANDTAETVLSQVFPEGWTGDIRDVQDEVLSAFPQITLPSDANYDALADALQSTGVTLIDIIGAFIGEVNDLTTAAESLIGFLSIGDVNFPSSWQELITPHASVEVSNISAGIEFPRSILTPLDDHGRRLPDPATSKLLFRPPDFTFSTDDGFSFHGDLTCTFTKSEILNTGLTLDFSAVKLDLSKTSNIAEADADGRPVTFTGVFIKQAIVTLPQSWAPPEATSGAKIIGSDLLIGSEGGFSGAVQLDATGGALTASFPAGIKLSLDTCSIAFHQNTVTSSSLTGEVIFTALKDSDGNEGRITITGSYQNGQYQFDATAANLSPLTLGPVQLIFESLSLTIASSGEVSGSISGTVVVPWLKDETTGTPASISCTVAVNSDGFSISASVSSGAPLKLTLGPVSLSLTSFAIAFNHAGIVSSKISGIATISILKDTSGNPAPIEFSIDLRQGVALTAAVTAPIYVVGDTILEHGQFSLELLDTSHGLDLKHLFGNSIFSISGFRLSAPFIPGGVLAGELRVVFRGGFFQETESFLKRQEPDDQNLADVGLKHVHISRGCLALTFSDPRLNYWLSQLTPELVDQGPPAVHELSLRVLFANSIQELRFDWEIAGAARTFKLPGFKITTPNQVRLSLLLGANNQPLTNLAFAVTFEDASELIATADFAWGRDEDREIQGDPGQNPDAPPLLQLSVAALQQPLTLVLMALKLDELKLPQFLRELDTPLAPFDFSDPASLSSPTPFSVHSLRESSWTVKLQINAERAFPFLKQDRESPDDHLFPQAVTVKPLLNQFRVDFAQQTIFLPIGITVAFGDIQLATQVDVGFNWEKFAFMIDHEHGLDLLSQAAEITPESEFLGLRWSFKGSPITAGPNVGRYHYLTLITKNHNYQLVQPEGAIFEVDYAGISQDTVGFAVSNFALTSVGVSLTATVIDRPARLNGIDTKFRFQGSQLVIYENRITDFTLAGSGPLPPALVGDATADVALQFSQRDGGLVLVSGSARLQGKKVLNCQGTRFRFSVDSLGLRFVNDGKFHLYFTITGSAEFVPLATDDMNGALFPLSKIKIDLIECPVTGDARILAKHVRFEVELSKPRSFDFLGAFSMELRAIGFLPQADVFDGDGAMSLTGQVKFAQGAGDTPDSRTDLHRLLIGLPRPGSILPRVHFGGLAVKLNFGSAFKLSGSVEFIDTALEKGFAGDGVLQIQGLPTLAASLAFLRVRRDEESPWLRAWFIYLEARQVSFPIPIIKFYLREIGLGFGYRFTLVSIKAADANNDVRALLKTLKELSRTQGDLSKRDRWVVDLEEPGQDPRWTIVLRGLFSESSAAPSPLNWSPDKEKLLSCVFLFDAVIAFRSDLTFLMSVRAWLNTNYYDYVTDNKGMRNRQLFNGFVLLSPRQKRLLANLSSNPGGQLGPHPQLPDFMQKALTGAQFTATVLIEPGLLHVELGWPNMLRWSAKYGPLSADFRGGFIWRTSKQEMVTGVSFVARGSLEFSAGIDLGVVGARVSATASVAYSARYIGVLDFRDPTHASALYGSVGLEIHINVSLEFWIKLKLSFIKITKSFRFSLGIGFTAGLQVGFVGISADGVGLVVSGTISVSVMGHGLHMGVRVALNPGAVATARARTDKFLQVGLEATEVESIPGTEDSGAAALKNLAAPKKMAQIMPRTRTSALSPLAATISAPVFVSPDYSAFSIRRAGSDDWTYFVLLPQGQRAGEQGADATPEPGFLPVPPAVGLQVNYDFELSIPGASGFSFEQFDPTPGARRWTARPADATSPNTVTVRWRVNWDAAVASGTSHAIDDGGQLTGESHDTQLLLRQYLRHAFITTSDGAAPETVLPLGDPVPLPRAEALTDERVHNPSDSNFESAVRGATEQFRGSPFFRHDLRQEYTRSLDDAFRQETTIYNATGIAGDNSGLDDIQAQQAMQLRGVVIHDIVTDLRDYIAALQQSTGVASPAGIAFEMGLVFRVKGAGRPAWLDAVQPLAAQPTIRQRLGVQSTSASNDIRHVRTFNIATVDFSKNPPQFQRVQQLTDATTIALGWDLTWEQAPAGIHLPSQAEPEHHLLNYEVRRRALDGTGQEVVTTVKPAEVLHRAAQGGGGLLQRLRPRFQVVDHFTQETAEDLASLPAEGRSYLYTITPMDFSGNPGRPLTLVATRFPSEPPLVPTDGELSVTYRINSSILAANNASVPAAPQILLPDQIAAQWSEPSAPRGAPAVGIQDYFLIFRRDATLPIGSYGLDSATQGRRTKLLPTTNARALPTDIRIKLTPTGPRHARSAAISLADLQATGVLPAAAAGTGMPTWRPESWRVYFQTVSPNGVPSALAPVQLLLRALPAGVAPALPAVEERRPAEIEWLPLPMQFQVLPPEDERSTNGIAHVPMPDGTTAMRFDADWADAVQYQSHPKEQRCIRFRWNQGPSASNVYPLELNAGYHLLELDIDAHTADVLTDRQRLGDALRTLQELQMVPAADLVLTPTDTLNHHQWEAWYPTSVRRRRNPADRAAGSEIAEGPWYSWRESLLVWPAWPELDSGLPREGPLHPFLIRILSALDENPEHLMFNGRALSTFNVDLQIGPPIQPGNLSDLLHSTPASADPYGWGVLQRFGLSGTFSLRTEGSGELLSGAQTLAAVNAVLSALANDAEFQALARHLHIELLYQPGQSISLDSSRPDAGALLALVQLTLRPVTQQDLVYGLMELNGPAGTALDLVFNLAPGASCTAIDQSEVTAGEIKLSAQSGASTVIVRTFRLPFTGHTTLLLRSSSLPQLGFRLSAAPAHPDQLAEFSGFLRYQASSTLQQITVQRPLASLTDEQRARLSTAIGIDGVMDKLLAIGAVAPMAVTDERSSYFTVPDTLAASFSDAAKPHGTQWLRFKAYAESLNSTDPELSPALRIDVPVSVAALSPVLPDLLTWSQRFFDFCGDVAVDAGTARAATANGPWIATAYPRAGSPAHAAPDPDGRLTYDHLLEDRWAHTYRYFVRPFGRYDLLWQSFRQSPAFSPNAPRMPESTPDPQAGGLDVVLERTHPVATPLVLRSNRLDPPAAPTQPAVPGTVWEVIIARHPEQELMERNQTVARQLAFQQVAFTLLRRFAYPQWAQQLSALTKLTGTLPTRHVKDIFPDAPQTYPDAPDHLNLGGPANDDLVRTLDLPLRLGSFQQGAIALHWSALPFYYEHRLLLVAQTASTVSPVNEVVQRDFEYRTPVPSAGIKGVTQSWQPPTPFSPDVPVTLTVRARQINLPLLRLWDSLPPSAQQQWLAEAPDPVDSSEPRRKFGSLPDPEVIYQIVETYSGNVEVQAEISYDSTTNTFTRRQLGRRFLVDVSGVAAPPSSRPQSDFLLTAAVQPVIEEQLTRTYDKSRIAAPTRHKIDFQGTRFSLAGVLTLQDRNNLLTAMDAAGQPLLAARDRDTVQRLYEEGFSEVRVSSMIALPAPLADHINVIAAKDYLLSWRGPITPDQAAALQALPGDDDFRAGAAGLAALAATPGAGVVEVAIGAGLDQVSALLESSLALLTDVSTHSYTALVWTGSLYPEHQQALLNWVRIEAVNAAIAHLIALLDSAIAVQPLPDDASLPSLNSIPESLRTQLTISPGQVKWSGRLQSEAQRSALEALGSGTFNAAVRAIVTQLTTASTTVPLSVPFRPAQAELPRTLRGQLLIGRVRLRCEGVLVADEGVSLRSLFTEAADQDAIGRLYNTALSAGMRTRVLRIRTRRGAAAPTTLFSIDLQPL